MMLAIGYSQKLELMDVQLAKLESVIQNTSRMPKGLRRRLWV